MLFFEHKRLYAVEGEVERRAGAARQGQRRARGHATSRSSPRCAACTNASPPPRRSPHRASTPRSIDLRTLRPLDTDTILASLAKTNRVVVVEEGPLTGGWAGELLALVTERGLGDIDDAWRITTPDSPIPYSPPLEDAHLPGADRIAAEIAGRLG